MGSRWESGVRVLPLSKLVDPKAERTSGDLNKALGIEMSVA